MWGLGDQLLIVRHISRIACHSAVMGLYRQQLSRSRRNIRTRFLKTYRPLPAGKNKYNSHSEQSSLLSRAINSKRFIARNPYLPLPHLLVSLFTMVYIFFLLRVIIVCCLRTLEGFKRRTLLRINELDPWSFRGIGRWCRYR